VPQPATNLYRAHDVRLGRVTKNVDEYAGLLMGLEALIRLEEKISSRKTIPSCGAPVGWGVSD
jgi:hypothetical protein